MPPRIRTETDIRLQRLGYDGSKIWQGSPDRQEWLRDLSDPYTKQRVFREMLENDPDIAAGTRKVVDLICAGRWKFVPPVGLGKDKQAKQVAEFISSILFTDMKTPWRDVVDDMLSSSPWGWSVQWMQWKTRQGRQGKPTSKYNDGLFGLHKIELRPQYTLYGWTKDENNDVIAMRQRDPLTGQIVSIPLFNCLHMTCGAGTTGPEGKAGLRPAYIPFRNQTRLINIALIGEEHRGAGCWVGEVPAAKLEEAKTNSAVDQEIDDFLQGLMQLSTGERNAIIMPSKLNPDGSGTGWNLDLKSTAGGANTTAIEMIRMFREKIMVAIGSQYLLLGMAGSTGTSANAKDQTKMTEIILQGMGTRLCEVINEQLVPWICHYNGINPDYASVLTYRHPRNVDLAGLSSLIAAANGAGVPIVDANDRNELREIGDLPPTEAQ